MNFIIIVSDTLRRDHLGCYGNKWISTPNIDRFAEKSIKFDKVYSGSFPTVPHRRDLLTGRFTAGYTPWAPLSSDEVVLAEVLKKKDYISMMVCDCPHILENGYHYDRGFDGFEWIRGQESDRWKTSPEKLNHKFDNVKNRAPNRIAKNHYKNTSYWRYEEDRFVARTMVESCRWLEDNYRRDKFFLYVDTFDPHEPWDAPQWYTEKYNPGYKGKVIEYPRYDFVNEFLTGEELKHCQALYAAEVTLVDRWVGRLFEKIEDLGLLEDTMVIFTTDHGFLLGEHEIMGKGLIFEGEDVDRFSYIPLYEEINHIPFIAFFPKSKMRNSDAIIQPMDIMPTILDLAEVEIPETVHGKSFKDVLTGKTEKHRDFGVSAPYLGMSNMPVSIVDNSYSAVLYPKEIAENKELLDKAIDAYGKKQIKFEELGKTVDEQVYIKELEQLDLVDKLYDLKISTKQKTSIANKNQGIVKKYRKKLIEFFKETQIKKDILSQW